MKNDSVGIRSLQGNDNTGSNEPVRPRWLADSAHRPQDNNLWQTYTDGFVDYTHEL